MECECAKVCRHCRNIEECNVFRRQQKFYKNGNISKRPVSMGQLVYYLSLKRNAKGDRIVDIKTAEVTGLRYDTQYPWFCTDGSEEFRFGIYLNDVEGTNDRLHNVCIYDDDLLYNENHKFYLSQDAAEKQRQYLLICGDKAFNEMLHNASRYI